MFIKSIIDTTDLSDDLFNDLKNSIQFENVINGRNGAIITKPKSIDLSKSNQYPIVRTTTIYKQPAQQFQKIHDELVYRIQKHHPDMNLEFNNALVELYDNKYRKMGYHSDQALDLEDDSYICLFSCYENNSNNPRDYRKLIMKNKVDNNTSDIILENNSAVLFSTDDNKCHLHKI